MRSRPDTKASLLGDSMPEGNPPRSRIRQITDLLDRWIGRLAGWLIVAAFVLWGLSHVFHDLESWLASSSAYGLITIVLVLEVIRLVDRLNTPSYSVRVSSCQDDALEELRTWIRIHKPKTADLIEYSGWTIVETLLNDLVNCKCKIRLLLQDPDVADTLSVDNADRIKSVIQSLQNVTFKNYNKATVKLYRQPASMRGRNFGGELINVGWYTYRSDSIVVWGHINVMITLTTRS